MAGALRVNTNHGDANVAIGAARGRRRDESTGARGEGGTTSNERGFEEFLAGPIFHNDLFFFERTKVGKEKGSGVAAAHVIR